MRFTAIYTKTGTGYSAYVPDLPGCIATGQSLEQAKRRMAEAVSLHIHGMQEDGNAIPEPTTVAENVEISAA